MTKTVAIAIHGGAGTILKSLLSPELELEYITALTIAVNKGYLILNQGGSSIEAAEASVVSLEDCPLFNAGRGAVFNAVGGHEMDAAIMEGSELRCGAVSSVQNVKNPVRLAKSVMEKSEHVFLGGEGAAEFGRLNGIEFQNDDYFYVEHRYQQWLDVKGSDSYSLDHSVAPAEKKFGTVGAVALDMYGNLAAATSTGGMTNKKFGRIGDSPIIGAGTYANNKTCAISCTGHGELFIRSVVAYDISCLMEYKGYSLKHACDLVVYDKLVRVGGEGGLVAIDAKGNIELPFNSKGMYRASVDLEGNVKVLIYK